MPNATPRVYASHATKHTESPECCQQTSATRYALTSWPLTIRLLLLRLSYVTPPSVLMHDLILHFTFWH
jgi:hypothetical protein